MQTVYLQNDRDIYLMLRHKDSWINQMAAKYNASGISSKEQAALSQGYRKIQNLNKQLASMNKRKSQLKDLENKGEKQLRSLEKQIAKLKTNIPVGPEKNSTDDR